MSRILPLVALVALLAIGCAENRASFFIQAAVPLDESSCTASASDDTTLSSGAVDLMLAGEYAVFALATNQLSARGNPEGLVAETNGILIDGANVRVWRGTSADGEPDFQHYQPAAQYVAPQGQSTVGILSIDSAAAQELATEVDALGSAMYVTIGLELLGTTNGGTEVQTPEFFFPVLACLGCLLDRSCPDMDATMELCAPGENMMADCRYCLAGGDYCCYDVLGCPETAE